MYNFWKHLRLAGAVVLFSSIFFPETQQRLLLILFGLALQYLGVLGGMDRIERIIDLIIEDKTKED